MKRGEIYFINDEPFNKNRKGEMKANHPAVIVSNDELNTDDSVRTVEIVYMTTKPQETLPTHVVINSALKPSTLLCEQVFTVSKDRLSQIVLGKLTLCELEAMDEALALSLGLAFPEIENESEETEELEAETTVEASKVAEAILARVKAEAERDIYKQLYTDLLEKVTKGAVS